MNKWTKRQLKLVDKYIEKLTRLYIDEYTSALTEIRGLVLALYAKLDDPPLLSHLYQFRRYVKLVQEIQNRLTQLGVKQEQLFTDNMMQYYKDNAEVLSDQFERPFSLTDDAIKEIVRRDLIDNRQWSESIWNDKAIVLNKLKHELVMHVAAGKSIDDMAKALEPETVATNFYSRKRLVRTEVVKYYVKTTVDRYKEMGVKQVTYHSNMDDRTCEQCREKDNKVYSINSKQLPPSHPNCRCYITPVI